MSRISTHVFFIASVSSFRYSKNGMKKRIFIAIAVPNGVKKKIADWQEKHKSISVRWIKAGNLHITVISPWYVTDDELYRLTQVLKKALASPVPFSVRFTRILFGPPHQPLRLIWAEGETSDEFANLKKRIENTLRTDDRVGNIRHEKRASKLHLTLARFRPGETKKLPRLNEAIDWQFEIDSLVIMESRLKRTGAEYSIVQKLSV